MFNDFEFLDDLDLLEEVDLLNLTENKNDSNTIHEDCAISHRGGGDLTFSVHATPDGTHLDRENSAYFKWANSDSFGKSTKIARIKFTSADYVIHYRDSDVNAYLNREQKKLLVKLLSNKISVKNLNKVPNELHDIIDTEWKYLIYLYNKVFGHSPETMLKYMDMNIPVQNLPFNFVRLTLPMPDYKNLYDK